MQQPINRLSRTDSDALAMRRLVMRTFCDLLQQTRLPPMRVLEYAAAAVGSVYREVADAHTPPDACPCGWHPDEAGDILALQHALLGEARPAGRHQLATAPVMGHA